MKLFKSTALIGVIAAVTALPFAVNASQEQITNGSLTITNVHLNAPLYVKCGIGDQPTHSLPPIQGDGGKQIDQYSTLNLYFGKEAGECVFYSDPAYTHPVAATMVNLQTTPVALYPLQVAKGYSVIVNVNPEAPYNSNIAIG